MSYIENPKTKGSGIVCGIPQGRPSCSGNCPDCFCLSGRSYLEPLKSNLPNMPKYQEGKVLRINDGLDSNDQRDKVLSRTFDWDGWRFANTAKPIPFNIPWVLTCNPGKLTNEGFHMLHRNECRQLMFVRFRINAWNIALAHSAAEYYTSRGVPVVMTFLAYFKEPIPELFTHLYEERGRTLNTYRCIKWFVWKEIMDSFAHNPLVYSCSGADNLKCKHCGHCLREFFRVKNQ